MRKVPSAEVLPFLTQPSVAQALQQKHGIDSLGPRCAYTEDQVPSLTKATNIGLQIF
jgi:hypothetical protein